MRGRCVVTSASFHVALQDKSGSAGADEAGNRVVAVVFARVKVATLALIDTCTVGLRVPVTARHRGGTERKNVTLTSFESNSHSLSLGAIS